MSNNMRVLLVGPGNMGRAYCRVLKAIGCDLCVIGRGGESASVFERELGVPVLRGGVEAALDQLDVIPDCAIIASTLTDLADNAIRIIKAGVKKVLLEKPGGVNFSQVKAVADAAEEFGAQVFVAYNRRFYASVSKALEIIKEDGGVTSYNFEFTELGGVVEKAVAKFSEEYKESWFVSNSTHVVDLAFFLGGEPQVLSSFASGSLPWHKTGCVYAGAGVTKENALFSYQANWAAPGRWGVEILTRRHRLYFRPLEKLSIQEMNSVAVTQVQLDDHIDVEFKPGLFRQVEAFLTDTEDEKKVTIQQQLQHWKWFAQIEKKDCGLS